MSYRNTYANINLKNLRYNIKTIIKRYNNYKYYIGVVKAFSYGHYDTIKTIIDSGCNYLAVSSLDEALEIREKFDIPILCLGIIDYKYIYLCEKYNIDITVDNIEYVKKILNYKVNIHIKIDTGMNRLGLKDKNEFDNIIELIKNSNLYLKGIYTHIYNTQDKKLIEDQVDKFKYIAGNKIYDVDIIHISQSGTLVNYPKIPFCNGCRLGLIMYGLIDKNLKSTFSLVSKIISIKSVRPGESVGYLGKYKVEVDSKIGIVPIGYADGVSRKLTGAYIYINNKKYNIIGNICMDMLMVLIDDQVKLDDLVYIYKDNSHIKYLSNYADTIPYELICNVSKRVPRKYINV